MHAKHALALPFCTHLILRVLHHKQALDFFFAPSVSADEIVVSSLTFCKYWYSPLFAAILFTTSFGFLGGMGEVRCELQAQQIMYYVLLVEAICAYPSLNETVADGGQ